MKVKINCFDHFGNGISKGLNKVIFIKRGLPNEEVEINLIKKKNKYDIYEISNIIKSNTNRVKPICPFYDSCGGCNFLHTSKKMEEEFKINKIKDVLNRSNELILTGEYHYRNKVTLHVKNKKIGYYKEGTNNIVEIDYCYLLNDKINSVIKSLKSYQKNSNSNINEIIIKATNSILVYIKGYINDDISNYLKMADTIIVNDNIIKGNGYITEFIDNKKFVISGASFFQVNKIGLLVINDFIKKNLKDSKNELCLDLYSGTSIWGILVSSYFSKVVSIEYNKDSYMDALINKRNNNINNIDIINGRVEDYIDKYSDVDLIILDPPRSGLDKKTINNLLRIKSNKIIYISCDIMTFKRDINLLKPIYEVLEMVNVDMFPKTYHVETVTMLGRKS